MLDVHAVKSRDLKTLSPTELTELASQMLAHIGEQANTPRTARRRCTANLR
jgi:hypothetical protein